MICSDSQRSNVTRKSLIVLPPIYPPPPRNTSNHSSPSPLDVNGEPTTWHHRVESWGAMQTSEQSGGSMQTTMMDHYQPPSSRSQWPLEPVEPYSEYPSFAGYVIYPDRRRYLESTNAATYRGVHGERSMRAGPVREPVTARGKWMCLGAGHGASQREVRSCLRASPKAGN